VAEIFDVPADVFAPCALGAVLNLDTIRRLKVSIVAGSANNQLAHHQYGAALHDNGILYAPDFVVNAGGLIQVAMQYGKVDSMTAKEKISDIYHTVMKIFARAQVENLPTNEVAEAMAIEMLK
jgi:leucine dehydrogenase